MITETRPCGRCNLPHNIVTVIDSLGEVERVVPCLNCTDLPESLDLEGKTVILSPSFYKGDDVAREFVCEDGFGCKGKDVKFGARKHGRAILGHFVSDNERCKIHRHEIERLKV